MTDIYLTDIELSDDLVVSPTGDIGLISGIENVRLALFHRLITKPGSLVSRPEYGVGLQDFQGATLTLATQRKIALRIQEQFARDPRVERVVGVSFETNQTQGLQLVHVILELVGGTADVFEFPV